MGTLATVAFYGSLVYAAATAYYLRGAPARAELLKTRNLSNAWHVWAASAP